MHQLYVFLFEINVFLFEINELAFVFVYLYNIECSVLRGFSRIAWVAVETNNELNGH